MTIRHLKIFVAVCRENNISLAAKKLFISQPAVSNAIKELEEYYDVKLFERISKKIYITEAGKKILNYALHINSLFDKLEEEIKNININGNLKIGASITVGTYFMPYFIKEYTNKYPEIQIYVTIDSSDVIENMVLNNELDFALIEGMVHSNNIVSQDFMQDELVVICDLQHPLLKKEALSIDDLSNQKFLMREKNSGTREMAESILLLNNISINPIWESTSTEAIIQGVARGIGISILPFILVQDDISRNLINKLDVQGLKFERQYHIIYHKNKYLSDKALEFINLCCTKNNINQTKNQ